MTSAAAGDEYLASRIELGRLLAGVKDLRGDFDSTETLALHLLGRRGADATLTAVLADVEACLRGSMPQLAERLPAVPQSQLQDALERARRDYDRSLAAHLEHARLTLDTALRQPAVSRARESRPAR